MTPLALRMALGLSLPETLSITSHLFTTVCHAKILFCLCLDKQNVWEDLPFKTSQQIHNETCTGIYTEEQPVREKSIGTTKHPSVGREIKYDIIWDTIQ